MMLQSRISSAFWFAGGMLCSPRIAAVDDALGNCPMLKTPDPMTKALMERHFGRAMQQPLSGETVGTMAPTKPGMPRMVVIEAEGQRILLPETALPKVQRLPTETATGRVGGQAGTGGTSDIVVSRGSQVFDLNGAWREAQYADDGLVYLLRDATTGELLKVGQTTAQRSVGRFEKYVSAGNKVGRQLEVQVFEVPLDQRGLIEGQLRRELGAQPGSLPWDNTGRRLGRPGPGIPNAPRPTTWYPEE